VGRRGVGLVCLYLARVILAVCFYIEQAVSAEVEGGYLLLPARFATLRFVDYRTGGVCRRGGRENSFCPSEEGRCLEGFDLVVGDRIDDPQAAKETQGGGRPVNPEAPSVHDWGDEGVPDRVHLEQRASPHYIRV